jgi:hypothetical protein
MTISQAQKHADQLVSNLVSWGLLQPVSAGKFRPTTSIICGTCGNFKPQFGANGHGSCTHHGEKFHVTNTCQHHHFNSLLISLIEAGLPS